MLDRAKLFKNGRSQAVRLPAKYRFEGDEVFIKKDAMTGNVILSRKPTGWAEVFRDVKPGDVPEDFMADREQGTQERDLF